MEPEKCTTILLPWMLLNLMYQRVRNFYCTSFCDRKSTQLRWMPTVAAVRACMAASGSVAGCGGGLTLPEHQRRNAGALWGKEAEAKESLMKALSEGLFFW